MTTPMGLLLPTVSVTPGPLWASELNTALSTIEFHDHSPGNGVQVSAAGLNINGPLSFNTNDATGFRTLRLSDQTAISPAGTDIRAIYSKNGDLYYRNTALAEVQITSGAGLVGPPGSITGLVLPAAVTYSSGTGSFTFTNNTNLASKISSSDLSLYEFGNAAAQPITIKSPAGVTAYTLTLPAIAPTQASVLGISAAGQVTYGVPDGSLADPSIFFTGNNNLGFYKSGTNTFDAVVNGTVAGRFAPSQFYANPGTVSLPGIAFTADSDTGFYQSTSGNNQLAFAAAGFNSIIFNDEGINLVSGTQTLPSYGFIDDDDTGMYLTSAGTLSFTTAGTTRLSLSNSGEIVSTLRWRGPNGTAAAPGVSFSGDTDTGMYLDAVGELGFTVGGTERAEITTALMNLLVPLSFDGGAGLKFKTHSDTATGFATVSYDAGVTVFGVFGWDFTSCGPIHYLSGSAPANALYFTNSGVADRIGVINSGAASKSYVIIIFYQ